MAENEGFGITDGIKAASGIVPAIMGAFGIGEKRQDRRQLRQQEKLQELGIRGSKELTDYNKAKELEMWNETNLGAQMQHAKEAGLSPGYLYSKGGGTTGQVGSGGTGMSVAGAADAASAMNAKTNQAMAMSQLALMGAQKDNIEADTKNKLAGANLSAEDLEKRKMDTLTQGEVWTKTAAESQEAVRGLEDRLKRIKAEATGSEIENEAKDMGIKVDKEKIKQMAAQVAQGWEGLSQGERKLKIDQFKAEIDANYPGLGGIAGKVVDNVLERSYEYLKGHRKEGTYKIK